MYRLRRIRFGRWFCIIMVGWLAVIGGIYLGRFCLGVVRQGTVPNSTMVSVKTYEPVTAPGDGKALMLNPIPVYYLQVGVYSDLVGAEEAAKPLRALGYNPYITQNAPFRLWLGVYQKRADTELVKQQLKDKGFGSFTASSVINGANLRYNKSAETFIQGISPVLDEYTVWLKENLVLFGTDSIARLNWEQVDQQLTVLDKVYNELLTSGRELNTNSPQMNRSFTALLSTVEEYQSELQNFRRQKDRQSFDALQYGLLKFIDNYLLLWEEINNISKT